MIGRFTGHVQRITANDGLYISGGFAPAPMALLGCCVLLLLRLLHLLVRPPGLETRQEGPRRVRGAVVRSAVGVQRRVRRELELRVAIEREESELSEASEVLRDRPLELVCLQIQSLER